jgi:hypothetical protein
MLWGARLLVIIFINGESSPRERIAGILYLLFSCFRNDPKYDTDKQGYQYKSPPHACFEDRFNYSAAIKRYQSKEEYEK